MEPIPKPSEMSVLRDLINIYMKENANSLELEPEELKAEAERLQKLLSKQAAGRVCDQTHEEREAAFARIAAYYKEKKEWDKLFQPRIRKRPAEG
jgi:hypothetical protein